MSANCERTEDFLAEIARMCRNSDCGECPLCQNGYSCMDGMDIRMMIGIVQRWSDEHGPESYLDVLKNRFPSCQMQGECPSVCRSHLFGGECGKYENCEECWKQVCKREEE